VLNHVSLHVGRMELIKTASSVGYVQEAITANGDTKKMGQAIRANLEAHTVKPDI